MYQHTPYSTSEECMSVCKRPIDKYPVVNGCCIYAAKTLMQNTTMSDNRCPKLTSVEIILAIRMDS